MIPYKLDEVYFKDFEVNKSGEKTIRALLLFKTKDSEMTNYVRFHALQDCFDNFVSVYVILEKPLKKCLKEENFKIYGCFVLKIKNFLIPEEVEDKDIRKMNRGYTGREIPCIFICRICKDNDCFLNLEEFLECIEDISGRIKRYANCNHIVVETYIEKLTYKYKEEGYKILLQKEKSWLFYKKIPPFFTEEIDWVLLAYDSGKINLEEFREIKEKQINHLKSLIK